MHRTLFMDQTLSIIGCGKLGKTLGRLWSDTGTFRINDVMNRTDDAALRATSFIGAGRAVTNFTDLQAADIYLIATPDDGIAEACERLADTGHLTPTTVVFHCSGALPSHALASASARSAKVASTHPIRSFAAPENLIHCFAGTYCGVEGDTAAIDILQLAFEAIGANMVMINADLKVLYHAAAVFASNYTTTLLGVAQDAYVTAGIAPDVALKLMEPLVRESIDNIFHLGPARALTGPIARGDMATIEKQQRAVSNWDRQYGELYAQFVTLTAELAAKRRSMDQ